MEYLTLRIAFVALVYSQFSMREPYKLGNTKMGPARSDIFLNLREIGFIPDKKELPTEA